MHRPVNLTGSQNKAQRNWQKKLWYRMELCHLHFKTTRVTVSIRDTDDEISSGSSLVNHTTQYNDDGNTIAVSYNHMIRISK